MKKLVLIGALLVTCTAFAQTPLEDTGTNTVQSAPFTLWDHLTMGSNYFFVPYTTVGTSKDAGWGGGLAIGYKATEVVNPVARIDYFASQFWMGSLTAQLQPPRYFMGKIPVVPFMIAGGAFPFSGAGSDNHQFVTIIGGGVMVHLDYFGDKPLLKKSFLAADYEQWLGVETKYKNQIRVGLGISF